MLFIKKETVFSIAVLLAVVSFACVRPGLSVVEGIDFRTLVLLYGLMAAVAGLQRQLFFTRIGNRLMAKVTKTRSLFLILVLVSFVSAMVLTNDVALITFVPFAILLLPMAGHRDKLPVIIILQTIAANLGSVLTPLGNPQNLYLYNLSGMGVGEFACFMLPLWLVSLVLVIVPVLVIKNEAIKEPECHELPRSDKKRERMYIALFILCLLCVFKILDYRILFVIVTVLVAVFDRYTLLNVDYILLLTFTGFFVFIYDMKQIPQFVSFISNMVSGREFWVGILSSQVISNVPAAILLSGFTQNLKTLLLAVDVGGLGTIIASMASLISYKLYAASAESTPGKYMKKFICFNLIYLAIVCAFCILVYHI